MNFRTQEINWNYMVENKKTNSSTSTNTSNETIKCTTTTV